jgi:hypothetical protein
VSETRCSVLHAHQRAAKEAAKQEKGGDLSTATRPPSFRLLREDFLERVHEAVHFFRRTELERASAQTKMQSRDKE